LSVIGATNGVEIYSFWLETLDEDTIQERNERLDGLESRLGSLKGVRRSCDSVKVEITIETENEKKLDELVASKENSRKLFGL
jgi:hypothetical protein